MNVIAHVTADDYTYVDYHLWVLDEVAASHGHAKRARLLRVDPYLGVVQVVGEWPRRPAFDRQWLVLDRDGQVLVVSSSSTAKAHTIVRLEATPFQPQVPLRISFRNRAGALALPPIVDDLGYSFAYAVKDGAPSLERVAELHLIAGTLTHLGAAL